MSLSKTLAWIMAKKAARDAEAEKCDDSRKLCTILCAKPLDLIALKAELWRGNYSPDALLDAFLAYLYADDPLFDECEEGEEYCDDDLDYGSMAYFPAPADVSVDTDRQDAAIIDVLTLFLDAGLDPAVVCKDTNITECLKLVDNEYLAADAFATAFRRCTFSEEDTQDLHRALNDIFLDVLFGAFWMSNRRKFDALMHCWMVWLGYTADFTKPQLTETFGGFELRELRHHRDFTFAITHSPSRDENWTLHIIDKRTFMEVARL